MSGSIGSTGGSGNISRSGKNGKRGTGRVTRDDATRSAPASAVPASAVDPTISPTPAPALGLRRTKIVCTLGPASATPERLSALLAAGMDVARINCSHGTQDEHAVTIARARAAASMTGAPLAILLDLQGPKIRTGALTGGQPITLTDGQRFTITTEPVSGTLEHVSTTYTNLPRDVRPGDRILLSDGALELRVRDVRGPEVRTEVVHGGRLAEHQGINLPGVRVSAPALTAKDAADLAFGVAQGVDFIALSFVRAPDDVLSARRAVEDALQNQERPATLETRIPIIAKLERPEAIERLDEILLAADGVMVARGDLGVEMPLEQVPLIQKRIIARANALGKPVITATQMLESMIASARPTRAEVSDVANAILDGTDAVMLSGETAVGAFPVEAVQTMARIAAEVDSQHVAARAAPDAALRTPAHAVASAAHTLAREAGATLLAVFTRTGASAHLISKERPAVPILAYTRSAVVLRRLALWWGVAPRSSTLAGTTETLIAWVDAQVRIGGLAAPGQSMVVMGGMPLAERAPTNFVKLQVIGE